MDTAENSSLPRLCRSVPSGADTPYIRNDHIPGTGLWSPTRLQNIQDIDASLADVVHPAYFDHGLISAALAPYLLLDPRRHPQLPAATEEETVPAPAVPTPT